MRVTGYRVGPRSNILRSDRCGSLRGGSVQLGHRFLGMLHPRRFVDAVRRHQNGRQVLAGQVGEGSVLARAHHLTDGWWFEHVAPIFYKHNKIP